MIDTKVTQPGSPSVRYALLDKEGQRVSLHYSAFDAGEEAKRRWPGVARAMAFLP